MSVYEQTKTNFLSECHESIAIAVGRNRDNIIGRLRFWRMFTEMCVFRRGRERSPMTICRHSLAYPFVRVGSSYARRIIRPSARNKFLIRALIFRVCRIVVRCRVGRSCILQLKNILNTLTILTECHHRYRFLVENVIITVIESESNHPV